MIDSFGRTIDYLRVSVTDRCNFRCIYCMPEAGADISPKEEILTRDEISRLISIAVGLGTRKIRFTGGEPLVRRDIAEIIADTRSHSTIEDISLTTNGHLLPKLANDLRTAGLNRINISLDTLKPERFTAIARGGDLTSVLSGIDSAIECGFHPVKINVVALRGHNSDEAVDFAAKTLHSPWHVRFIELMPIDWSTGDAGMSEYFRLSGNKSSSPITLYAKPEDMSVDLLQKHSSVQNGGMLNSTEMRQKFISAAEIKESIENEFGALEPVNIQTNGPARTFRIPGALGTIGFISQITNDICANCNRMRLTADGFLRPCLMAEGELDLRSPFRNGATDSEIADLFLLTVKHKPYEHRLEDGAAPVGRGMSKLGG